MDIELSKSKIIFLIISLLMMTSCGSDGNGEPKWGDVMGMEVIVLDPRGVGGRHYAFSVVPLVLLDNGDYISPRVIVKYPRKGFMGVVYGESKRQIPEIGGGPTEFGRKAKIAVPIGVTIKEYIFLIKSGSEETGWRVLMHDADDLESMRRLEVPDLLDLPLLDDLLEKQSMWDAYLKGKREYELE